MKNSRAIAAVIGGRTRPTLAGLWLCATLLLSACGGGDDAAATSTENSAGAGSGAVDAGGGAGSGTAGAGAGTGNAGSGTGGAGSGTGAGAGTGGTGSGSAGAGTGSGGSGTGTGAGPGGGVPVVAIEKPLTREQAARFLTQATFGPIDADIDRVMALGYSAWIDEQLAKPAASHRAYWEAADASIKAANPAGGAGQEHVLESFWKQALAGDDQLRQRWAYALSQVFVISMQDQNVGNNPRAVAAWLDMLAQQGSGNYRNLLESVSRHPLMGQYLSHLRNRKTDTRTGRVPDENFAREVMQLFSIGLVELNADGSARLAGGRPLESYGPADVAGLAKVFTGWSWACPEWPDNGCFQWGAVYESANPDRSFASMVGYPQYHSPEEKKFLGTTIAAQSQSDPQASLDAALDAIAAHPNVGPFLGRQLIQRLVTSNPSPQYVAAVSAAFKNSGGNMGAMLKAVLMHPEARRVSATGGKLREPVLKYSAFIRAFGFVSQSGNWRVGNTDGAGTALGQTPLRSPSVFNFYRPGYVPPGTESAGFGLAVPELQIAYETTAAGYVNFMRDNIAQGAGQWNVSTGKRDLQADFSAELALADQPAALLDRVNAKLLAGAMPAALKAEIQGAIEKMPIPVLNSWNQQQINDAKRARVNAAVFLAAISPEFQVQK